MASNTQYTRSRNHNIATGGTQAATWAQIFAGVVLLLGKTTRLVPSRGDTSRVVFPNKRTTSAKICPGGYLGPASGGIVITRACVFFIACHQPSDPRLSAAPPPTLFNDIGPLTFRFLCRGCGCTSEDTAPTLLCQEFDSNHQTTDQIFAEVVLLLGKTTMNSSLGYRL